MSRSRDFGIIPGIMPPGPRNAITDVQGVSVGHVTLSSGEVQTGVTAIVPQPGNLFENKAFQNLDGYEHYLERYTATKKKFT